MKIQRVSSTVRFDNKMSFKGTTPPQQNSVISEDKEISKELAEASKAASQVNMQKSSRVGERAYFIPDDWYLCGNSIITNYCTNGNNFSSNYLYRDENKGKCFELVNREARFHSMYGYPIDYIPYRVGAVYIENDGSMTIYKTKNLGSEIDKHRGEYSGTDIIVLGLLKDGREEEVISVFEKNRTSNPDVRKMQLDYFISCGREDEAIERYPDNAEYINNKVNSIKHSFKKYEQIEKPLTLNDYLAKGDFRGAVLDKNITFPKPFNSLQEEELLKIADYIEDEKLFETWAKEYKENELGDISDINNVYDDWRERLGLAILTLGTTEVLNQIIVQPQIFLNNISANYDIRQKRELITLALLYMLKAKEEIITETKDFAKTSLDIQASKEPAKELLQQRLIQPIRDYKSNQNIDVPNCVMLTGNNPYVAKDLDKWIEKIYGKDINCVKLSSKKDIAQMHEDILEALESAEENYQETNKRSVIFVNGMEKLLRNDINDSDDIAVMKDLMDKASRYFHSTIVFYAKEPNKLDPGTVVSHRVGLKINLPDYGKEKILAWRNI